MKWRYGKDFVYVLQRVVSAKVELCPPGWNLRPAFAHGVAQGLGVGWVDLVRMGFQLVAGDGIRIGNGFDIADVGQAIENIEQVVRLDFGDCHDFAGGRFVGKVHRAQHAAFASG